MAPQFKKAKKFGSKLRLAFIGPSGSGKTYSSLSVASHLGGRIAVIDSERGSASKYADLFEFDVLELESFAPERYVEAIQAAERAGYDIVIVDSLSHAWMGKDGALEMVDNEARRGRDNSFAAWRKVTPKHNEMVDALVSARLHVIATMRSKTEWVVEKDAKTGKSVPRKIGMAPVQRDGLEYEFDVVGDLDIENVWTVTKTRCPAFAGKLIERPGEKVAEILKEWLSGEERQPEEPKAPPPPRVGGEQMQLEKPEEQVQDDRPLADRIRSCETRDALVSLKDEVMKIPSGTAQRKDLAELWAKRRDELSPPKNGQQQSAGGAA